MYVAAGWVLAEVAGFAADTFGAPAWVVQMFTILILLGFPLVLIGAWAFDLTPQGLKRDTGPDEPADTEEPAPVAAAPVVEEPAEDSPSAQSIAVLPFADMSPDKDQEYFSDGIAEELLNLLAKIPQLFVAARTSAFAYKGKDTGIEQIGRELKVAHVLEGSVRKAGNTIRVTAQLIQAENGYHLWSETWDRTLEDIFAVQDEIAAIVVEQLKLTLLTPAPVVQETDPEAYALHLQGLHFYRQGSAEGFEQAVVLAEQALALAPDYAPAWDLLASVCIAQADKGLRPIDEGYRLGREATEKALAIDPNYAWSHAALSAIASGYDGDWAAAAQHMQIALTLDPTNPDILRRAATLAKTLGRPDTAIAIQEYVAARDPVNSSIHHNLGLSYYFSGRLDEAIASCRTALRMSPESMGTHSILGDALLVQGDAEAALQEIKQEPNEMFRLIGLSMAYHALGRSDAADSALSELIEKCAEGAAYNIAYVMAGRGETDQAFEWLDKAVEYRDPGLQESSHQALFATIHSDPRWEAFLTRIGKSKAQLDAIQFDVKLPQ
jgi:TolB-like protein/lipoprotein NlpI